MASPPLTGIIQIRVAFASSPAAPSVPACSPGSARSLAKAIHLPSGLHAGELSVPMCVSGRRPPPAVQSQRSCRKIEFFQSGVSVPIAAAWPSGERAVEVMSVVLKNSSSEIAGFADWAKAALLYSTVATANTLQVLLENIRAI